MYVLVQDTHEEDKFAFLIPVQCSLEKFGVVDLDMVNDKVKELKMIQSVADTIQIVIQQHIEARLAKNVKPIEDDYEAVIEQSKKEAQVEEQTAPSPQKEQ